MADIEIPAVIDKSDIVGLGKLAGSSNASPVTVDGQDYAVGKLCFIGFSGTTTSQNLKVYSGVFRFKPADGLDHANRKHFDFLKPKTSGVAAQQAKPAKPARGEK